MGGGLSLPPSFQALPSSRSDSTPLEEAHPEITIRVVQARGLSTNKPIVPMVELVFRNERTKTSSYGSGGETAVWNESFTFPFGTHDRAQYFIVNVKNTATSMLIGTARIGLDTATILGGNLVETWYKLTSPETPQEVGEILLRTQVTLGKNARARRPQTIRISSEKPIDEVFEFIEQIGSGTYSVVELGIKLYDTNDDTQYALKIFSDHDLRYYDTEINDEIKVLAAVDHPGIVGLHEVVATQDGLVLVLDFIGGGSMFDRISESNFSEDDARLYTIQILHALDYLHDKNIVNRNLKPENIHFESASEDSRLVIVDFGVATFLEPNKKLVLRETLGSQEYNSPEIELSEPHDTSTDMWSLGVLVYTMLCGYQPFLGESEEDVHAAIVECVYQYNDGDWQHVTKSAKNFIDSLLVSHPSKRLTAKQALAHPWIRQRGSLTQNDAIV
eukprot:c40737_g1_i1.p1 GENE.c40737_g1_i1~~c40737_g1_i1.p1  ORF type:complete len:446 (+),score=96.88 c40737_g1_i1:30-1367(+)